MIENEITERVFARKPFTAIEIASKLYPNNQSEYSKILDVLKTCYLEILDYYDSMEIDVKIKDGNSKKTVTQVLYYPWEYNPKSYKHEFDFHEKYIIDNNTPPLLKPKIAIDNELLKPDSYKLTAVPEIQTLPTKLLSDSFGKPDDSNVIIIKNVFSDDTPKPSSNLVIKDQIVKVEKPEPITEQPLIENKVVKTEAVKPFSWRVQSTNVSTASSVNNIAELKIKQTDYKKEIIILRSQTVQYGINDLRYSMSFSNKRIILKVQENGPLHSDERGLKINKSFLDLVGLSDIVNVTIFSDKSLMITQA
jgi:hypothetical protein